MQTVPLESIEKDIGEYFKYVEQTGEKIIITDQKNAGANIIEIRGKTPG